MSKGFYTKLAFDGIRKNRRLYFPYVLTGSVMVMMSYIIFFLSSSDILDNMKGGGTLRSLLPIGSVVVGVFSLIFMFYSNTFIMRRRNREFGLYNVLGMDKYNIGRIMISENLISAILSIVGGLFFGILFSKFSELIMCNILLEDIEYEWRIDFLSAVKVTILFLGIFAVLLINSLIRVFRSRPTELLKSDRLGEKPPKANFVVAIIGALILAVAYAIALSVEQPTVAIVSFMIAVVMVIIATYMLFVSGSVALCKILQKNKRYYYRKNHFVSVSSMSYRMKRNGAGLASICILITMVLVMLSSTTSLYAGTEETIKNTYPYDISMKFNIPDMSYYTQENIKHISDGIDRVVSEKKDEIRYAGVDIAGYITNDGIITDTESIYEFDLYSYDRVGYLHIISLYDYNRIMEKSEVLADDECLLYEFRMEYDGDTFKIQDCDELKVRKPNDEIFDYTYSKIQLVPTLTIVVNDLEKLLSPITNNKNSFGADILSPFYVCEFNTDLSSNEQIDLIYTIRANLDDIVIKNEDGSYGYSLIGKEEEYKTMFGLYAGLFFVGILLSIIFIFATVLIIYYKQISEGYEDRDRFEIMQKVGMTKKDIRKSINSQVITVFFSPLLLAGLHLGFAFPITWKMLQMFNFENMAFMIVVNIICFAVFAVIYAIVYKITSNAYYRIVCSDKK